MVEQNTAPDPGEFCVLSTPRAAPVIRFPGGAQLEVGRDPTLAPDACSYAYSLIQSLQGAFAPMMPVMNVIDLVCLIVQFVLALKDAVTDPFAIPKMLGMVPALAEKLNKLLSLVPVFPQGVVAWVQTIVDVIYLAIQAIDCALTTLHAAQANLAEATRITNRLNAIDDEAFQAGMRDQAACIEREGRQLALDGLAALAPIARLLCLVRSILILIPGGAEVQARLAIPDLTATVSPAAAIEALTVLRDGLSTLIESLVALTGGLGLSIGAQPFECPLDATDAATPARVIPAQPVLIGAYNPTTGTPVTLIPAAPGGVGLPSTVMLIGSAFAETTTVYAGTTALDQVVRAGPDRFVVEIPAALRAQTGTLELRAISVPTGTAPAFTGIDGPNGEAGDTGSRVSNAVTLSIV